MSTVEIFDTDGDYLSHQNIVPDLIENRKYQLTLARNCIERSSLVSLPTGLGKTTVSLLITAERLKKYEDGKSLLLAPNKPLVQQHTDFYKEALDIPDEKISMFTGEVRPEKRGELWDETSVVIATPQVIENDLVGGRISMDNVVHITFDECHRATGDYSYVYIAERYNADSINPLITGMSASPGGTIDEIKTVATNLGIKNVEVMTEEDSDVSEYTYDVNINWHRLDLPEEIITIRNKLNEIVEDRLERMKNLGVTKSTSASNMSMGKLNSMRQDLLDGMDKGDSSSYKAMSYHAEVVKLKHAITILESQGVQPLRSYFERRENSARSSGASKASTRLVSDDRFQEAKKLTDETDILHPKLAKARELVVESIFYGGDRVIIFTEYRDTAEQLTKFLSETFDAHKFVGQQDKQGSSGMSQSQQKEVLDQFRNNEFDVLVSTSVAEEGLDVPEVDLVLFYEPVPKGVRSIQRAGRTGRQKEGNVSVLIANDTSDIGKYWKSVREQKTMKSELSDLKEMKGDIQDEIGDGGPTTLDEYMADTSDTPNEKEETISEPDVSDIDTDADESDETNIVTPNTDNNENVEIVVDQRELDSTVARTLSKQKNIDTKLQTLDVGDYVLSDRAIVERKSVSDFVDTLVGEERSIFEQVGDMAKHYSRPIVMIEGTGLYTQRNVHPNAIRGAIVSLILDFNVSIVNTEDENDTAALLQVIAEREQTETDREISVHGKKTDKTLAEQQEYIISSMAEVGPVTSRSFLEHFGSVKKVINASIDELKEVDGVGEMTAKRVHEVIDAPYNTD